MLIKQRPSIRAAAVLLGLLLVAPLAAQLQTGNIYGTVQSSAEERLPGAQVTLTGQGAPRTQTANERGEFRFLGLPPGDYAVQVSMDSFGTIEQTGITVSVGHNTTLSIDMPEASVEDVITVTGEAPLLDERRITTGTTISQQELEALPTSRDPWAVLQQAPGVTTDRVNVGGNESGQQSNYINPGTSPNNSAWAVDGVTITDMGAIGSSPSYYNFDSFEEMEISTGGTDASLATGGVGINMVTKRGTNDWRFSARYLHTDDAWQSDLNLNESELGPDQPPFKQGNRITAVDDYGIEGGGPLVRDKVWAWASYGVQEIDLLTVQDFPDFTELESYAAKVDVQATPSTALNFLYHYGDKVKIGRNASPTRPPETTWDQTGPTDIYKIEASHVFTPDFYLSGMWSYVGGGFELVPQGGGIGDPNFPNVVFDQAGVAHNSYIIYQTDRPQNQARVEGSYFLGAGDSSHELRFGVGLRSAEVDSFTTWPGLQMVGYAPLQFGPDTYLGWATTETVLKYENEYESAYLQDTVTFGDFTLNLGLRLDKQTGTNLPSTQAAAPAAINQGILLGGSFEGGEAVEWTTLTPRVGVTWKVGDEGETLVRASYAQFADQLGVSVPSLVNPSSYQTAYFFWSDSNGDLELTADEVGPFLGGTSNLDFDNPGTLINRNHFASGFDAPRTDELLLSVEHAIQSQLVVGASATARTYTDIIEPETLVIDESGAVRTHRRDDYVVGSMLTGTLEDGSSYSVPHYTFRDGITPFNGWEFENGDREQDYQGYSLWVHKRLANRWSLRGYLNFNDWEWDVPAGEMEDPTLDADTPLYPYGNYPDGSTVVSSAGGGSGPKGDVYLQSGWSYNLSGLYQVAPDRPWGFDLAADLNGREGYPLPQLHTSNLFDNYGTRLVLAADVDRFRNDDVHIVNASISKVFEFGEYDLKLSLDGFNLTNDGAVLQRETQRNLTSASYVREVLSPRVFRLGARLSFR